MNYGNPMCCIVGILTYSNPFLNRSIRDIQGNTKRLFSGKLCNTTGYFYESEKINTDE